MESQEEMLEAVKSALQGHFGGLDASQDQLKVLLMTLDAKLEALAKSLGPSHIAAVSSISTVSSPRGFSVDSSPNGHPMTMANHGSGKNNRLAAVNNVPSAVSDKSQNAHADIPAGVQVSSQIERTLSAAPSARASSQCDRTISAAPSGRTLGSMYSVESDSDNQSQLGRSDDREYLMLRRGFQDLPAAKSRSNSKPRPSTSRVVSVGSDFDFYVDGDATRSSSGPSSHFRAWSPDSTQRRILDILGLFMVLYDAVMVPFWLAWNFTWPVGFWTTCVFWTIDLPSQFVTGFRYKDARLELDLGKAALNYVKTWFLLDITVVLCDWINALANVSVTMRYLRVMKLVRGARQMFRFFLALQKWKLSSKFLEVHLSVDISLLLAFILWVNHVVCCGWYWIGEAAAADSDTGLTWIRMTEVSDVGTPYEYSTSLHWALTQMTPASMEVVPACTMERVFNVLIIVGGMILGSVFAATLTSSMTQYRLYKERVSNNFMQLQSYLAQQGVEPELSMAVKMHVKNQLRARQRLHWKNVAYLDYASKSLKEALWHSCCMKCIRRHSFLHTLNLFDSSAMNALCNSAMITVTYSRGDILFEVGVEANEGLMHYIVYGCMFYDPGPLAAENDLLRDDPKLHLGEGAFFGEAALWTAWKHLGTMFVESPSEVLQLNSAKLQEALSHRFPDVMSVIVQYSFAFHASLHELGTLRSDLGSSVDNLDLMSALDTTVRLALAEPILEQLRDRGGLFGQKSIANLENEIQEGKCNLGFQDEEPVRTVFVVALKLRRAVGDGRFLVKVGEFMRDTNEYKAACVLPGTKRKGTETSRAALERAVNSDLVALMPFITVLQGSVKTAFLKNSPTYGVRTRYLRTTFNAELDEACGLDTAGAGADWAPKGSAGSQEMGRKRLSIWLLKVREFFRACFAKKATRETLQDPGAGTEEVATKGEIIEILREQEHAVIMPCDGNRTKCTINLWLTQEEYSALQHESATPLIRTWLTALRLQDGVGQEKEEHSPIPSRRDSKASGGSDPTTRPAADGTSAEAELCSTTGSSFAL